ncbi:unnamed protein product [Paramecium pentaurelia]|uniref:Protein kinase domain-containing protein n=1 Tax=Paramecium pentaurelia TaxID=43138 RepID=A0A8S1U7H0_9CILI|nr:unnamed protein product [Paramecium pentaurelia]
MLQNKPSRSLSHHTKITDYMKKFIETNYRVSIPSSMKQSRQNKQNKSIDKTSNVFKVELPIVQQNVCLKQSQYNKQEKERELLILKALQKYHHPCIIELRHHFMNNNQTNLLFDFMPLNLTQVIQGHRQRNQEIPLILIKSFAFQLLRAITQLHECQICHRNIQPDNILINNHTFELKLADFSQAKFLFEGEDSINNVNNVRYRAPELLLGTTKYNNSIDLWAYGCVIYEMWTLNVAFDGNTQEEVIAEIIKILGVPKKHELQSMKSQFEDIKMPQIKKKEWEFSETIEFIKQFIKYTPNYRGKAQQYLNHQYFKDVLSGQIRLNGRELPNIKNLKSYELEILRFNEKQ